MIDIKIGKHKVTVQGAKTILLSRWIEYLKFLDAEQPNLIDSISRLQGDEQREAIESLTNENYLELLEFYIKEIEFWTGLDVGMLRRVEKSHIEKLWVLIQKNLNVKENGSYGGCVIDSVAYFLPKRLMQDSTIEDFAEANEFEKQAQSLAKGSYEALYGVCAVLLRKENEGFDDYDELERAELFRQHLTVYDAHQVGFFLHRLSNKSLVNLQIYMTSSTTNLLKRATSHL